MPPDPGLPFERFLQAYGPGAGGVQPTPAELDAYRGRVPDSLLQLWETHGWRGFGGGLIWLVDPASLAGVVDLWIEGRTPPLAIARTAFADLYLLGDRGVLWLGVQHGELQEVALDVPELFDEHLCSPRVLEKVLHRPLFEEGVQRLGPIDEKTCYGFEPLLALGGSRSAACLRRVALREHLALLNQVVAG